MKSCSLKDFMQELEPWLDGDHIKEAFVDDNGHFVLLFMDGMKNVYDVDDCNVGQVKAVLEDLKSKGVPVS